jgi:hypothetical protein
LNDSQVTVSSDFGEVIGVGNWDLSEIQLFDVTILVSGNSESMFGFSGVSVTRNIFKNVKIDIVGGVNSQSLFGMYFRAGSNPGWKNLISNAITISITGTPGSSVYGIYLYLLDVINIEDFTIHTSGGSENFGIYVYSTSYLTIQNSRIESLSGTINYGVYNDTGVDEERIEQTEITSGYGVYIHDEPQDFYINGSSIKGSLYSVYDESGASPARIFVGSSRLQGPVSANGANYYCIFSYNAYSSALNNLCQ